MPEAAIISRLLAATAVKALVSNRVFPISRPQGSVLPAITLQRIDGAPLLADDGDSGLENPRLQLDCWGGTYGAAKAVARAVKANLNALDETLSGVQIPLIELEAERDMPRESGTDAADYLYRVSLDFLVWRSS